MPEPNSLREFVQLLPDYDGVAFGTEPVVSVEEKPDALRLRFDFPGYYFTEVRRRVHGADELAFVQLQVPGAGFTSETGFPRLPSFGRYIQIPLNCEYESHATKVEEAELIDIELPVFPSQVARVGGELAYEEEWYRESHWYPEHVVEVLGRQDGNGGSDLPPRPFELDGYSTLLLHVRPLQYNPAEKKLRPYPTIEVEFKFKAEPVVQPSVMGSLATASYLSREAFGNLYLNPTRHVEGWLEREEPRATIPPKLEGRPEFVIIYHKKLENAAVKLAQWKKERGLSTETVSVDEIGNDRHKLKLWVHDKRAAATSRLRYVLLLGDVDRIESGASNHIDSATDYYYSTEDERRGHHDLVFPRLSVGRIPVRKEEDADAVVDKIIRYEENPPCDPEYYRRLCFVGLFQAEPPEDTRAETEHLRTMEEIREHMSTLGFDVERLYVKAPPFSKVEYYDDGTEVPLEVQDSIVEFDAATNRLRSLIEKGEFVIAHLGHGTEHGWCQPTFEMNHLKQLEDEFSPLVRPTVFYSLNCQTGWFDLRKKRDCFAEALLKMTGGAPSVIAATRTSDSWLNNNLLKALFDAMWPGVLPTFPATTTDLLRATADRSKPTASYPVRQNRLGDILNYAKSYLALVHWPPALVMDHFEMYHVIGDPTLELWKAPPVIANIDGRLAQDTLKVSMAACPVGSVVTIWHRETGQDDADTGRLVKQIEPTFTHFTVPLREIVPSQGETEPGVLTVCFSAPGHRFRQVVLRVPAKRG